jgi:chromosome segregation protein
MYLSHLEVVGFKSFAQKIKFKFNQGISAIVGPNGCGKTNVVDAIRWVLGEQKTAVLRSELMENVIFNGTKNRKALGMAEVTLIVQNNRGVLPSDYTEVSITRRLFRDGESEYLINNTKCRLRDILDLFMDTGMGADSYSVIELKMVEAILSGRPEERRHLIEEAAGVNKYKLRRKEANRKLQNIQADLMRVQDIVQEVEKQVNTLARQAAKTKRYNKLYEQHKDLELALIKIDFQNQNKYLAEFEQEIKDILERKILQEKELNEHEKMLEELAHTLNEVDFEYQQSRDKENNISKEIAQKTKDIAVSQEKLSSIEKAQDRIKFDVEESSKRTESLKFSVTISKDQQNSLIDEIALINQKVESAKIIRDDVYKEVNGARFEANSSNEEVVLLQNSLSSIKSNLNKNKNKRDILNHLINNNYNEIEKVKIDLNSIEARNSEAEALKPLLNESLSVAENDLNQSIEKQNALKNELENLRQYLSENKNNLSSKNAQLEFLSSLIDVDDSSKFLLNNNWATEFEKTLLIEAIGTDEKYRVAVEAALGDISKAFIVESRADAEKAIELLINNKKGKVNFICKDSVPYSKEISDKIEHNNYLGWLAEIVRVEEPIRNLLRIVLGKTAIVENLITAKELVDNNSVDTAVTLKGEIVRHSGVFRGGDVLKKEGQTVGKKERINELKKSIKELNKKNEQLGSQIKETKIELEDVDIPSLTSSVKRAENEINKNEQLITQLTMKAESLVNNIGILEQNLARYEEELSHLTIEDEENLTEINDLESNLNTAKEELQVRLNEVRNSEEKYRSKDEELKAIEMQRVKVQEQFNSLKNEIARNEADLNNTIKRLENYEQETVLNEKNLFLISENISEFELQLQELNLSGDSAKSEREFFAEKKSVIDEQIEQYSKDLSAKRKNYDKIIEQSHQFDLKTSETKTNIKNLLTRAIETFSINIDAPEFQTIEIESIENAKEELKDIKEKLAALGNVNFMALEEFEAQNTRFNFYIEQLQDLTESEKTLQETISEINDTAEKKFIDTFNQVNTNFQSLVKKLFNEEAEGELKLTGENILDCDIEIIAKPPGKKPHSIEMLSQGEKTLTAIALLFGIYLVKPSPFCILDEVDAPLDDANVDRFLAMIKQFSVKTQFLMVTHNKKTMTAADTLYGITMQEEGVSKVVSVRLAPDQDQLIS